MRSTPRECTCGSGEPCWPMSDGYGIFLTYVCDHCVAEKRTEFRDDIFSQYQTDEQIEEDW
jgi:hypothetical protein